MKLVHVCEGCGEEFISHRAGFCEDCTLICTDSTISRIAVKKSPVLLRQVNERNRESKEREKRKRRRRIEYNAQV